MHRHRRCPDFPDAVFSPLKEWELMNQQFLALARALISQPLLHSWCKHHALHFSPHTYLRIMRGAQAHDGGGRAPPGGACVIYTQKPTDQENEALTTKITYNAYTPCLTQKCN